YLALSYVWGGDQIHKTTKSNIFTYEQGIPPSLLPATIRDAIRVTHMLGFRLLWVDSLCIIQDSEEDKLHEIGHMHNIYRYAHLTIMAGSAEGASKGFLHRRPPPEHDIALPFIFLPHHLTSVWCWDGSLVTQSQVGQVYFASISSTRKSYNDELGRMATRAWCLQEYLLSPRTLLFTPRTVLSRCLTATQAVGNDSPCFIVDDLQLPKTLFLRDPPVAEPGSKEWKDMRTAWMKVVEDYSGRTVGVESDKLVACAAVAEQFRRALDSAYLAGLWSSDMFLVDLLWETVKDSPNGATRQHTRPRTYRAPSWSWAAVDGVVRQCPHASYLEDTQTAALVNIMECGVVLEDAALPFGRVLDGALWLR
ncbi:HET-domain-containing protein, partial [Trametes versicolor FP-101664 SS1]|uniref:HET-domain-containing protein n=1 Tax=Trametes versicolor (strain FP-101664) TaxID=717944 RepID=UPI0004623541